MGCSGSSHSDDKPISKPLNEVTSLEEQQPLPDVEDIPPDEDLKSKEWYHGKISTTEQAEKRLREGQGSSPTDGSYLVYDHPNEPGNYVLLVWHKDAPNNILRWKITRVIKDDTTTYKLGDNGKEYPSVRELIKAHRGLTGTPIQLQSGKLVVLSKVYVLKPKTKESQDNNDTGRPLEEVQQDTASNGIQSTSNGERENTVGAGELNGKVWYHGKTSDIQAAKSRLQNSSRNINGSYIVYDHPLNPDQYIILVYYNGKVGQRTISKDSETNLYMFEGGSIGKGSVKELIKVHRGKNGKQLQLEDGDQVVLSKTYVSNS